MTNNVAAIYGRASTMNQGDTVENQVAMLKEYAKRMNIPAIFNDKFIYEDKGESGYKTTLLQRPAMRRLINDIDKGLVQTVLYKGVSRFARDSGEAITTVKRLVQKGVRVISMEENYDSDRDDPTMFQIFAVIAEQESRKTGIRVSLGNKQKARNGLYSGTIPPLGYQRVKDIEDETLRKELIANGHHPQSLFPNDKAIIVQTIFDLFVNKGYGRKKIVSYLNSNPHYKTPKGNMFSDKFIRDCLSNEVYIGHIVYGKTRYLYVEDENLNKKKQIVIENDELDWARKDNAHPHIISKELFDEAQKIIKNNENKFNFGRKFNAAKHPLTGILKCHKCNGVMICQKRTAKMADGSIKEYRYYVCSTYHSKGRHICNQKNVNADVIEDVLFNEIDKYLKSMKEKINRNKILKSNNDQRQKFEIDLNIVEKEIDKKITASSNLLENMDLYDHDTFSRLNSKISDDLKKLRERKRSLNEQLDNYSERDMEEQVDDLITKFEGLDLNSIQDKRTSFHQILKEVYINDLDITKIDYLYHFS